MDRVGDQVVPAAAAVGTALQDRAMRRLVGRGLLRLCAFTPTDASHVLGEQTTHDPTVARMGADLFARRRDRYGADIADDGVELSRAVTATLVRRSAEALLAAALDRDGLDGSLAAGPLVAAALDRTTASSRVDIGLGVPLVGLGAPAATYYPAIGELLGTEITVPADADVANAIGAVVADVRVRHEVLVTAPRRGVYRIHVGTEPETKWERPEAQARAREAADEAVREKALAAGTTDFEVETEWIEKVIDVDGRPMFVEGRAIATASGRPHLA